MADYRDWSDGWLKEGHFLSYLREGTWFYEKVVQRDLAHWEYDWDETVSAQTESGHFVPNNLEITRGYSEQTNLNQIWQIIFGIKGQSLIYIQLPTDTKRHGIPKETWPSTAHRYVAHFDEMMSPYVIPSFITEHFLMRPEALQIGLTAYNPHDTDDTYLRLNFFINKLVTERVGTEQYGQLATPVISNNGGATAKLKEKWFETLQKLWKGQIPCRPVTILPVQAPAVAPAGE